MLRHTGPKPIPRCYTQTQTDTHTHTQTGSHQGMDRHHGQANWARCPQEERDTEAHGDIHPARSRERAWAAPSHIHGVSVGRLRLQRPASWMEVVTATQCPHLQDPELQGPEPRPNPQPPAATPDPDTPFLTLSSVSHGGRGSPRRPGTMSADSHYVGVFAEIVQEVQLRGGEDLPCNRG